MEKEAIFSYSINREQAEMFNKPEILISAYNMDKISEIDYFRINDKLVKYMDYLEEYNFTDIVGNLFQIFEELGDYALGIILKQGSTTHTASFSGPSRKSYTCRIENDDSTILFLDGIHGGTKIEYKHADNIINNIYNTDYLKWSIDKFSSTVFALNSLEEKYKKEDSYTKGLLFE